MNSIIAVTGVIVEWCGTVLPHRIIERWEGLLVDVCVTCRTCVPEIGFDWSRARYPMLMRVHNDVILGLTTPD